MVGWGSGHACDINSGLSWPIQVVEARVRQALMEVLRGGHGQSLSACVAGTHLLTLALSGFLHFT